MAALFEGCEIRSVFDNSSSSPGYIVQARATAGDKGFVFPEQPPHGGRGRDQHLARSGGNDQQHLASTTSPSSTAAWTAATSRRWLGVGTAPVKTGTGTGSRSTNPPPLAGTANGGATDAVGWREAGSTDLSGAPFECQQPCRRGLA